MNLSTIMSIAVSRSSRCHSLARGGRYKTSVWRLGEFTSCSLAAPFGHSRPREIGERSEERRVGKEGRARGAPAAEEGKENGWRGLGSGDERGTREGDRREK